MTIQQLQERLDKAIERKNKKFITIERKEKQLVKKRDLLKNAGFDGDKVPREHLDENYDLWNKTWDICYILEDIERNRAEIQELDNLIEKYRIQLENEYQKEDFHKELPEVLKQAQETIAERWYHQDLEMIENARKMFHETHDYKTLLKKYGQRIYNYVRFGVERNKLLEENKSAAKYYIIDLYRRVVNITGEVTDCSELILQGHALNGVVQGKLGKVIVETIIAGGYAIQREHYRALVKEVK